MSKLAHSNQDTMDEIDTRQAFASLGFKEAFGLLVKDKRNVIGWTQEELAKRWGKNRTTLANIETGRQNPTFEDGLKLMNILNIKQKDIVHEHDYMIV